MTSPWIHIGILAMLMVMILAGTECKDPDTTASQQSVHGQVPTIDLRPELCDLDMNLVDSVNQSLLPTLLNLYSCHTLKNIRDLTIKYVRPDGAPISPSTEQILRLNTAMLKSAAKVGI